MVFVANEEMLTTEELIKIIIDEFLKSKERKWMVIGDQYYQVENDIKNRKMIRYDEAQRPVVDEGKANNRLCHSFMHLFVEDKINYLLSRPYTLSVEDEISIDQVTKILGENFQRKLIKLGREASNKGIAWLLPYIGKEKKVITKIEYYTDNGVEFYVLEDGEVKLDSERYLKRLPDGTYTEIENMGHFFVDDVAMTWGKIPAIPFKNNDHELPDIKFIKTLIDDYDKFLVTHR